MRTRLLASLLMLLLAGAALLPLAACGARIPHEDPSIRGEIVAVLPADGLGSIAVESEDPPAFAYDKATVRITADTTLLRETTDGDTEAVTFEEFRLGQRVDVWFTGPVAESYPVQATAGLVLLRE